MAELQIWMNGVPVGVWTTSRHGMPILRYHESWVASEEGRALSLSLPFTADREHRGELVNHYFEKLLPDSAEIRRRLRRRFHARSGEACELLTAIGRDCVGAVQLLPPGADPAGWDRIEAERLSDGRVERLLGTVTSDAPLGPGEGDDFRITIAGAQEKTALLRMAGKWHLPHGATPTTYILKLPLGLIGNMRADMTGSVEIEWVCSRIMAGLGIPMAETGMATFGAVKVLVVTRFDRRWLGIDAGADRKARFKPTEGAWIARLPQEDLCQALGMAPDRRYQSDGGPSMQDCLQILSASENAEADRATFALAQFAFWLLAATDGHAKNFSIQHRRGGRVGMTPLYDVLSAWPIIGDGPNQVAYPRAKLAMAVRSENLHYRLRDIQPQRWKRLTDSSGGPVRQRMKGMAVASGSALDAIEPHLPPGFPGRIWTSIAQGVRRHAQQFLRGAQALQVQY
jgi:serine/threonine-protein kinase HipA